MKINSLKLLSLLVLLVLSASKCHDEIPPYNPCNHIKNLSDTGSIKKIINLYANDILYKFHKPIRIQFYTATHNSEQFIIALDYVSDSLGEIIPGATKVYSKFDCASNPILNFPYHNETPESFYKNEAEILKLKFSPIIFDTILQKD